MVLILNVWNVALCALSVKFCLYMYMAIKAMTIPVMYCTDLSQLKIYDYSDVIL